jgi:hypothetical protein
VTSVGPRVAGEGAGPRDLVAPSRDHLAGRADTSLGLRGGLRLVSALSDALRRPFAAGRLWVLGSAAAVVVAAAGVAELGDRGHDLELAGAALLGVAAVLAASSVPRRTLGLLVGLLPFDTAGLGALFHAHVPGTALRALGAWYELLVAGLVLAALRHRRRLDGLDLLALGYLVVPTFELLAPGVLSTPAVLGGFAPPPFSVRLLAWRADTLFVIVFLAARALVLTERARERLVGVFLGTGGIVAAIGCFELVASRRWNAFATRVLDVPSFKLAVLHVHSPLGLGNVEIREVVGGHLVTRVGSVLFSPVALGFYLVAVAAVALESVVLGPPRSRLALVVVAVAAVALLATVTRSAILSAVVAGLVILRPRSTGRGGRPGRDGASAGRGSARVGRARLALLGLAAAVLLVPVAAATGATARSAAGLSGGQDVSQHLQALDRGMRAMLADPLGRGLGTAPGVGNRFDVSGELTSESAYLQVGDELGIPELVVFVWLYVAVLRRLGRRARSDRSGLSGGLFAAGVALAVGGLFLHVWLDPNLALSFFGMSGAALGGGSVDEAFVEPRPAGRRAV